MSTRKSKYKTLSEKVAESFVPRPLADPENCSEDETAPKFAELDEEDFDFGEKHLSEFRKRNVKILSEYSNRYKGKLSSRKELDSDEDDEGGESDEESENATEQEVGDADDDLEQYRKKLKNCQLESEPDESLGTDEEADEVEMEEQASDDDDGDDDSDYDSFGENGSDSEESGVEDEDRGEILKETDNSSDVKKGLAVQSQLKMWEKLLEVRIHSQKMLIKANSLPSLDEHDKICSVSDEYSTLVTETKQNLSHLLDKMIETQKTLTIQFSETKDLLSGSGKKRQSSSAPNNSDMMEPPTKKFAALLQSNFESFRDYQNSVLQKWHDRTKILAPGSSKGNRSDFDVLKKIEAVLLNKNDLIKKSQIVKGNYKPFSSLVHKTESGHGDSDDRDEATQEEISSVEIYDDTDFYHQQLRELIEFKANTSASPAEITKQFSDLQKLRQKMKKKVDTRASKGRKIRYVVHNKLVNFMAPYDNSEWTDESKNELYRSLFAT